MRGCCAAAGAEEASPTQGVFCLGQSVDSGVAGGGYFGLMGAGAGGGGAAGRLSAVGQPDDYFSLVGQSSPPGRGDFVGGQSEDGDFFGAGQSEDVAFCISQSEDRDFFGAGQSEDRNYFDQSEDRDFFGAGQSERRDFGAGQSEGGGTEEGRGLAARICGVLCCCWQRQ